MMKTILYATDYSENSISALRLAYTFSQKFDCELVVMHVFDVPLSLASPVSVSYMKKEKKLFVKHRTKLKEFCAQHLDDAGKDANINLIVDEDGSVTSGILENSKKFNADLICVGTKGSSAAKEFFLGSSTKALLRKAACPVLAVPSNSNFTTLKTIAYATAFEQADVFAIRKLAKIAKKLEAEIRLVHVTTPKEYAGEEQMEWFKDLLREKVDYAKMEFDLIFSDTVFEELLWYIHNSEVNLLAMLERKDNSFYQRYLQTDLVKKMVTDSNVPLLSFGVGGL